MSRTNTQLAADLLHTALRVLRDAGGELPSREVIERSGPLAEVSGKECELHSHTGNVRWKAVLHLQSIGLVKAGFLMKKHGIWYLTQEGEKALSLSESELWKEMTRRYREWKANQGSSAETTLPEPVEIPPTESLSLEIEQIEEVARGGIEKRIRSLGPYEFQELVAALLRGMGYHTPFVAPRGKDGGVDVVAYKDPLGTEAPSILCQVKHRPETAAGIADVQRLMGALQFGKSVGLFVTSGSFSNDARQAARTAPVHVELIDMKRFIDLWASHYDELNEDDRSLLRLRVVHVLA